MANQRVRVTPVRRESVDIDRFVAGLVLLAQQLASEPPTDATRDEGSAA
jgi:hypothetical protein